MRVGMNPAKFVKGVPQPEAVTVALLVYIPVFAGYFEQCLDVLKLCLASVLQNTDVPFDLLVFDNGSCVEVQDYLVDLKAEGRIQYLVLSQKNIGKVGAWNLIFGAAPGEYVAYSDSDVFFHPGWLSEHMRILEAFPDVGTVTGFPHRRIPKYHSNTITRAEADPNIAVERGLFIPEDWIEEHILSLGKSAERYREKIKDVQDVRLHCKGVSAFAAHGHFQFVARTEVLRRFVPLESFQVSGPNELLLDQAINDAGYLRLATLDRYVEHMGNTLTPRWVEEARRYGLSVEQTRVQIGRQSSLGQRMAQRGPVRRVLMTLYCRSFSLLYHGRTS